MRGLVLALLPGASAASHGIFEHTRPWPLPKSMASGHATLAFSDALTVHCNQTCSAVCASSAVTLDALPRYRSLLLAPRGDGVGAQSGALATLNAVSVCVGSDDERLGAATDESYSLDVPGSGGTVRVSARSVYGVVRALETLTQLVAFNDTRVLHGAPISIDDAPAQGYRALMVTPAIAYLPIGFLEHIVDGLCANKLNVLHVHWSDVSSFPFASEAYPRLAKGAYAPSAVYTPPQLRAFVEYARTRAVRVIPEFDMPGHGGWHFGMPELVLEPCPTVLDVTSDATYEFLAAFLAEVASIFPDEVLMLGGDEVGHREPAVGPSDNGTKCFELDARSRAWLRAHNMSAADATDYFWRRVSEQIVPALNRTLMVWHCAECKHPGDPRIERLPKGTIANVWGNVTDAAPLLRRGTPLVFSTMFPSQYGAGWYLPPYDDAANPMWPGAYTRDPCAELGCGEDERTRAMLLGGGAAQWGDAHSNFDDDTWVGAMAVAERLWLGSREAAAGAPVDDATNARLAVHSCRMRMRGMRVAPYSGLGSLSGMLVWPFGAVPRASCPADLVLS